MYHSKFLLSKISIIVVLLYSATALSKDSNPTSVFDLTLGEPFNIRECKYEIVNVPVGRQGLLVKHTVEMYAYTEETPSQGACFKREGVGYTTPPGIAYGSSETLPPAAPVVNGAVKLIYAADKKPSIVGGRDIWLGVQNSQLTSVKFYFPKDNFKDVHKNLVKKYGEPNDIDNMYLDRAQGRLEFYVAKWQSQHLQVKFTSVDPDISTGGFYSQVGSVLIKYQSEAKPVDVNPL